MQREDDFFRQHRRQPERLARRQLLDLPSRRALPSRPRLQARARRVVEGNVEDAVVVVFGIDAALRREPLDNRVERLLARERKIEERSRLMRLRLRPDQPRRGPRGFLPEPPALKHRDLDALRREPPRDRTTYNTAADYQSFHSNQTTRPATSGESTSRRARKLLRRCNAVWDRRRIQIVADQGSGGFLAGTNLA